MKIYTPGKEEFKACVKIIVSRMEMGSLRQQLADAEKWLRDNNPVMAFEAIQRARDITHDIDVDNDRLWDHMESVFSEEEDE